MIAESIYFSTGLTTLHVPGHANTICYFLGHLATFL